jgi:DNA-binding transcriptional LysR family regulator
MDGKNLTNVDWEDLRHFMALTQAGTLLGAARLLGVEHATISRRVASLENSLSKKLIDRRGRRIVITPDGDRVAKLALPIIDHARSIEQFGRNSSTELSGSVRISAPPALSSVLLVKPLLDLRRKYPSIEITLAGEKRFASLNRREADIALRLSRPEAGDYSILRLGSIRFHLYATDDYLAGKDPMEWTFIGYDESMKEAPQQVRLIELAAGRPLAIRSSVLEFQVAAAMQGGGVAMLPEFAVAPSSGLRRIGDEHALVREIWLVVHREVKDVPSIRAVVDAIKDGFEKSAAWSVDEKSK